MREYIIFKQIQPHCIQHLEDDGRRRLEVADTAVAACWQARFNTSHQPNSANFDINPTFEPVPEMYYPYSTEIDHQ